MVFIDRNRLPCPGDLSKHVADNLSMHLQWSDIGPDNTLEHYRGSGCHHRFSSKNCTCANIFFIERYATLGTLGMKTCLTKRGKPLYRQAISKSLLNSSC